MLVLAKICGQDRPSGIAEWVQNRKELLVEALGLQRETMPHHSAYRRILVEVVNVEELEQAMAGFLSRKKYLGRQVLVAIDGKVLRGTLDADQNGTYVLAAYLPAERIVLMEVAIQGRGSKIPAAGKVLKSVDLREKVVMGNALHTQKEISKQIVAFSWGRRVQKYGWRWELADS